MDPAQLLLVAVRRSLELHGNENILNGMDVPAAGRNIFQVVEDKSILLGADILEHDPVLSLPGLDVDANLNVGEGIHFLHLQELSLIHI